ncbi:MAG: amidase family protein [Pseudomonadota bacterium]
MAEFTTATDIAKAVRSKHCSATEVTRDTLARQDEVNPSINAIVQPMHDAALARAREIDEMIAQGDDPGPLAGVPVTIKVNVDQAGYATTNGLSLQQDAIAQFDSPFVKNLENAGCVFVGRTNTPSFSLRWFTKNKLHGQTLNPRNAALTPGGSSGGAAAAVAAGLCAIGHGTDIAGSIRYPAYACGIHGLRPSFGRVPTFNATSGDRYIGAQLMAVSGPLARRIEDLRLALIGMSGIDANDPWSIPDIAELPNTAPKRVGLCVSPDGLVVSPDIKATLVRAARSLETVGWRVEEVPCPPMREAAEINTVLWMAETQFAQSAAIEAEADPEAAFVFEQMKGFAGSVGLEEVMEALRRRGAIIREWEAFFTSYQMLILPSSGQLPFEQQLDVRSAADFADVFEAQMTQRGLPVTGLPALAVAAGNICKGPMGVQLVSGRFRESTLLDAGAIIEAEFGAPDIATPLVL